MKIGIDATICFTKKPTGLGIYTINIVNALNRIHDDIVVWIVDDTGLDVPGEKVRKVLQPFRFTGGKLFQIRPLWINMFLPALMKKENIDVLYSTVPSALTKSPVPHLVTVHDLIPLTFPGESPKPVCWNYRHRIPKILYNATALVAISEYTKQDLQAYYRIFPDKIHTVYEGFDEEVFSPRSDLSALAQYGLAQEKYILYVGNASKRKNLPRLITAFSRIKDAIPHKLVLAGSKTFRERRGLRKLITHLGLHGRVMSLDYVRFADLPVLYSGADLVAYLSLYEGFGLPVLEAMACGTPVLASITTSIPEVAGEAAVLVDPVDEIAIAGALAATVTDTKRLQELSVAGLKRCKEFAWEKTAREMLTVLQQQAD